MARCSRRYIAWVLALTVAGVGCGHQEDTAPPVATASMDLGWTEAAAGSPVDLTYRFRVADNATAFADDYWVFVHFVNADGRLMWTDDHQPPTPTREWRAGATVEYSRTVFLPKYPYDGETHIDVGLYSPESGERLPLAGRSDGQRAYHVAAFTLLPPAEDLPVFGRGWYDPEGSRDTPGLEWRWSGNEATISFRNPRRDAVLLMDLDQPVTLLPEPQRVDVRIGETVLDSFLLSAGRGAIRRVRLGAEQLGGGDTAEVILTIDRTFVPASIEELHSADERTLGVRASGAFVEPQ